MSGFGYNVNGFGAFPSRKPPYLIDILVVGGGGGGGGWYFAGGGGGAGGMQTLSQISPQLSTNYTVTIGAGSSGYNSPYAASAGSNSVISGSGITTTTGNGGGGGTTQFTSPVYKDGGCGGGAGVHTTVENTGGTGNQGVMVVMRFTTLPVDTEMVEAVAVTADRQKMDTMVVTGTQVMAVMAAMDRIG